MLEDYKKIIAGGAIVLVLLFGFLILSNDTAIRFLIGLVKGAYKDNLAKLSELNSDRSKWGASGTLPFTPVKKCSYETTSAPTHARAIFSEIAWMGDAKDAANEWIIIQKRSATSTNISGWQIVNQNERLKITVPPGKVLEDNKPTFTFARHSKIDGIKPDLVFVGAIKNSNEGLRLFDNNCNLIDEVLANPDWPAGNNKTKKPMERLPNLSWRTFGETKIATPISLVVTSTPACININTAPKSELVKIIHVGDKTADKIIVLRTQKPFSSLDDLIKVRGIGTTTLADIKIQGLACVK